MFVFGRLVGKTFGREYNNLPPSAVQLPHVDSSPLFFFSLLWSSKSRFPASFTCAGIPMSAITPCTNSQNDTTPRRRSTINTAEVQASQNNQSLVGSVTNGNALLHCTTEPPRTQGDWDQAAGLGLGGERPKLTVLYSCLRNLKRGPFFSLLCTFSGG